MTDEGVLALIHRRRDRAIAAILGVKERDADCYLPPEVARRLRKTVLDQINGLTETFEDLMDTMGSEDDDHDVVVNEVWLNQIAEMHRALVGSNGNGAGPCP